MKFELVTSMNRAYHQNVGHLMISSFIEKWPSNYNIRIYHEDNFDIQDLQNDRCSFLNIFDEMPESRDFVERHKNRPDQQHHHELRFGAVRFSYKSFSIMHASLNTEARYLIWLDADVFTHTKLSNDFLETLVHEDKYVTYLGRENNYTETGFLIFNTSHEIHQSFMNNWRNIYVTDKIFKFPQWHDCFIFDRLREYTETRHNVKNINLSPWGKDFDHVFINSVLGDYMDHLKGDRKINKKSNPSDLYVDKDNLYWKK